MLGVSKIIRDWLRGRCIDEVSPYSPPVEIEAASKNLSIAAQRLTESTERLGEALIEFERVMQRDRRR